MSKPIIKHRIKCPKCGTRKTWKITYRDRRRCSKCRHTFTPKIANLNVNKKLFLQILKDFILELGTNKILECNPEITKYHLLKIMQLARIAMTADVPAEFSGTVEVDETYMGGSWKNKRLSITDFKPPNRILFPKIEFFEKSLSLVVFV